MLWENPGQTLFTQTLPTPALYLSTTRKPKEDTSNGHTTTHRPENPRGNGQETETHRMPVTQRNELKENSMRNF